jgi:phosphate-selective porin OprO/OprP
MLCAAASRREVVMRRRTRGIRAAVACAGLVFGVFGAAPAGGLALAASASSPSSLEKRVQELEERLEKQERQREEEKAKEAKEAAPLDFRTYWKDGLRFTTNNGKFDVRLGGRIQLDGAVIGGSRQLQEELGEDFENGVEFRRARLYLEGLAYEHVEFKIQLDFAGGSPEFKDVYMGLVKVPYVGGIRVGQFKEPFSLEELTSSNYITFMERSLPNALVPSRQTGIMAHNTALEERLTWAAGAFAQSDDFGDSIDGDWNVAMRLTGLPWYADGGRKLFHVGADYFVRRPHQDTLSFAQRPEVHLAPNFVDTGDFAANTSTGWDAEAALVYDSFSLQSEYIGNAVDLPGGDDATFSGVYVFASYFITGEHRPYKTSSATFDKVVPKRPFWFGNGGPGAWEIAARYSYLNLDQTGAGIEGGRLQDVTVGVNWYLNANTRIMLNYVNGNRQTVGDANMVAMRFQFFL